MGRAQMITKLEKLPKNYPVELTQASVEVFPWWLWIPNTGRVRDQVIGCGINRIALVESRTDEHTGAITSARFVVVHADNTALLLNACLGVPYSTTNLEPHSKNYNYWVHWQL